MYHNNGQFTIYDFILLFDGKLRSDNRWVRMSHMMPWDYIEQIYLQSMSAEKGRPAISARITFGALFIKEFCNLSDEGTVEAIRENPYMQYFLGLKEFQDEPLFDPSMMVHFRKRFPVNEDCGLFRNSNFAVGKTQQNH